MGSVSYDKLFASVSYCWHVEVLFQYKNLNSYYFCSFSFSKLILFQDNKIFLVEAKIASSSKSKKIIYNLSYYPENFLGHLIKKSILN